jgi:hypothetical protein
MNENPSEEASTDMAKKISEWIRVNGPRIPRTIRWVQIATGIFLVGLAYHTGRVQFDLIREGIRASGHIVRFEYVTSSSSDARGMRPSSSAFYPIVEFRVDGRSFRFRDRFGSASGGGVNDPVTVLFSSDRPSVAMIERPFRNWMPWAPTFVVGAFLLLVGAIGKLKERVES